MRRRALAAAILVFSMGALCNADEKPIERTDVDKRVVDSVYLTALKGTELFNAGHHEECYRLYQGALMGLAPFLDHRQALAESVRTKMTKAETMKPAEGAFVLRAALDEIQNEIAPSKAVPKSDAKVDPKVEPKKMSLWDRLGGEKTVRAVVKDFLTAAMADKKVNFSRDGKFKFDEKSTAMLEQHFVELLSEYTHGPLQYTGKRNVIMLHADMKITDAEFDAMLAVFYKTLMQHKVGKTESEELMKIMNSTRAGFVEAKKKGM